ncbi:MAG: methyltransferase domain-containing protein [Pseudomonadota bacterium]
MKGVDKKKGIMLDVGCGEGKDSRFVGMDVRKLPGVDIVHDLERFPWPLPDECCLTVVGHHVVEHIKPWLTIPFFDEIWRVMKPGGQLALSMPYAGSPGFWQDPTHCNGFIERTFWYFDPTHESRLYDIYKPKPWSIEKGFPVYQPNGNLEVLMRKPE